MVVTNLTYLLLLEGLLALEPHDLHLPLPLLTQLIRGIPVLHPPPDQRVTSSRLPEAKLTALFQLTLIKKNRKIFSYIRKFSGAIAYMRKGFLMYEEMRKYLTIYEEGVSHIVTLQLIHSEFPYVLGKFYFLFISVNGQSCKVSCAFYIYCSLV